MQSIQHFTRNFIQRWNAPQVVLSPADLKSGAFDNFHILQSAATKTRFVFMNDSTSHPWMWPVFPHQVFSFSGSLFNNYTFPKGQKAKLLNINTKPSLFLNWPQSLFSVILSTPSELFLSTTTPISIPAYRTICISCNIPNFYLHSSISKYVCLENRYSKSQNYLKHLLLRDAFTDLPSKSFSPWCYHWTMSL